MFAWRASITWNKASLDNVFVRPPTIIKLGCERLSCKGDRKRESYRAILQLIKYALFTWSYSETNSPVDNNEKLKPNKKWYGRKEEKQKEWKGTFTTSRA